MASFSPLEDVESRKDAISTADQPGSGHPEAIPTYSEVIFRLNKHFIIQQIVYFTVFTVYLTTIITKYKHSAFSTPTKLIMASIFAGLLVKLCVFAVIYRLIGDNTVNDFDSNIYRAVVLVAFPIDDYLFAIFGYVTHQMVLIFTIFEERNNDLLKIKVKRLRRYWWIFVWI